MKKPRPDAKLLNLPEEQQGLLAEWLLGGMPYHRAAAEVEKAFGVRAGKQAFSDFWYAVCQPALLRRRERAVLTAEQIAEQAAVEPGKLDAATIDLLKQKAFEMAMSPGVDAKDLKSVFMLVLKARDQDTEAAQLAFEKLKFATAACAKFLEWFKDAKAREIAESNLSNADKIAAMRKEYFKDVDALEKSGAVEIPKA